MRPVPIIKLLITNYSVKPNRLGLRRVVGMGHTVSVNTGAVPVRTMVE